MRDLLRRLIDSLSELTHWLGDRDERQLSLGTVVTEVQAVARALERANSPAELQGLTRRLHIVAAAAESEMKRTVHDLDQARHAAFRATVLAAELTIRSVRNDGASLPYPAEPAQTGSPAAPPAAGLAVSTTEEALSPPLPPVVKAASPPRPSGIRWLFGGNRTRAVAN